MTTHSPLLILSPIGELSEGMRRMQLADSSYFNRRRRQDGPLIRARFYSKRIRTDFYRRAVVRFIDAKAVSARVVASPEDHEFGSARAYLVGPRSPWLCRVSGTENETHAAAVSEIAHRALAATVPG